MWSKLWLRGCNTFRPLKLCFAPLNTKIQLGKSKLHCHYIIVWRQTCSSGAETKELAGKNCLTLYILPMNIVIFSSRSGTHETMGFWTSGDWQRCASPLDDTVYGINWKSIIIHHKWHRAMLNIQYVCPKELSSCITNGRRMQPHLSWNIWENPWIK